MISKGGGAHGNRPQTTKSQCQCCCKAKWARMLESKSLASCDQHRSCLLFDSKTIIQKRQGFPAEETIISKGGGAHGNHRQTTESKCQCCCKVRWARILEPKSPASCGQHRSCLRFDSKTFRQNRQPPKDKKNRKSRFSSFGAPARFPHLM